MHLRSLSLILLTLGASPSSAESQSKPTYFCTGTQTTGFIRDTKGEMARTSSSPLLNFVVYPHTLTVAEQTLPFWDQGVYRVKITGENTGFGSCFEIGPVGRAPKNAGTINCSGGDSPIQSFTLFESSLKFEFSNVNSYADGDGSNLPDNPYIEIGNCDVISD